MLFTLRLIVALVVAAAGSAALLVAYNKWVWAMKMVFGRERVQKMGSSTISLILYIVGGALLLNALFIIF